MPDIAIARLTLHLAGIPAPSGSPHALVREIMQALERELDAALGPIPEVIVVPRMDVDIRVDAAGASALVATLARRLAEHIATAARVTGAAAETAVAGPTPWVEEVGTEAGQRALLGAARALTQGISPGSVKAQVARLRAPCAEALGEDGPFRADADAANDVVSWPDELMTAGGSRLFALLGELARRRQLRPLVRALVAPGARADHSLSAEAVLLRIRAHLDRRRERPAPMSAACAAARERLRSSEERARHRLSQEPSSAPAAEPSGSGAVGLVLAVAEECRLLPDRIERSPALAAAIVDAICKLQGAVSEAALPAHAAPLPRNALVWLGPAPTDEHHRRGSLDITEPASVEDPRVTASDLSTLALSETAESPRDELLLEEDTESRIDCTAAGLAFLIRPLLDLGWLEALNAVHDEPTLVLVSVLRRVLELQGVAEEARSDPAAWLLAGLRDAPSDEELAADARCFGANAAAALSRAAGGEGATIEGACDAWARAAIAEAQLRLDGTQGANRFAEDVLLASGAIIAAADRIEVVLPFIGAYEALLRAGLLADIPAVPWLGGRPLRFLFEGPEHGGTP